MTKHTDLCGGQVFGQCSRAVIAVLDRPPCPADADPQYERAGT